MSVEIRQSRSFTITHSGEEYLVLDAIECSFGDGNESTGVIVKSLEGGEIEFHDIETACAVFDAVKNVLAHQLAGEINVPIAEGEGE